MNEKRDEKYCNNCDNSIIVQRTPREVHFAKRVCSVCEKHFGWVGKPKNKDKKVRKKTISVGEVSRFHGFTEEFCFLCLRKKNQLGENETLTTDHILELQIGGEDKVENIQILCSACHKLKNWIRLYFNWHFNDKKGVDKNDGAFKIT